jgi:O-antigen/teichoic acid export membrane protein
MEEEKEGLKTESFVKNSLWNVIVTLFSKLGGMVFVIILARLLLSEKFGIYNLALSIVLSVLSVISLATNQSLSRYVSYYLGKNNPSKAKAYYIFISKVKIILSLILMLLLILLAYPLSFYIFKKPELFLPLLGLTGYILIFSFQNIYETMFYVLGKVKVLIVKESIIQFSKIILCLFLFVLFSNNLVIAILSISLASFIAIIFMRTRLKKYANFLFTKTKAVKINKSELIIFIKQNIWSSISVTLFESIDMIILGILVASSYIGYYSSAFLVISGLWALISLSNISLPVFTKLSKTNLESLFNKALKYLSLISIPLIFLLFLFGKYLILGAFGEDYANAIIPFLILSPLIFEFPLTDNIKSLFLAKGKPYVIRKIVMITIIFNIILTILLVYPLIKISMMGAVIGVSIALLISRYILLFLLFNAVKKELTLSYNIKFIFKPFFASIIMIGPLLLINLFIPMGWIVGIVELIFGIMLYVLVMVLTKGIEKEDLNLLKRIFSEKLIKKIPVNKR